MRKQLPQWMQWLESMARGPVSLIPPWGIRRGGPGSRCIFGVNAAARLMDGLAAEGKALAEGRRLGVAKCWTEFPVRKFTTPFMMVASGNAMGFRGVFPLDDQIVAAFFGLVK